MIANSIFLGANTSHNTNLIFVEKEILAEYGHFIVKMLSLQKKQNVCKRHITSYSYQSKKGGIKKAILITRLIKLKMNQFKEEECSFIPGLERQWKTAFPQHIIRTIVIHSHRRFFLIDILSSYLLLPTMVQTRSQLENLSKEELIGEL